MFRMVAILLLAAGLAAPVFSDVPLPKYQEFDPNLNADQLTLSEAGTCSIIYYNLCSGWVWIFTDWNLNDEVGVIFDLPESCLSKAGDSCCNTGFWWYWRWTLPTRGYTVSYHLYQLTDTLTYCKSGAPLNTIANQDPLERWNFVPGLGCGNGTTYLITATWDRGPIPYVATDNNVQNAMDGCAPVTPTKAKLYHRGDTEFCPPADVFFDDLGPTNLLMRAEFTCTNTATEDLTWGKIKGLFR